MEILYAFINAFAIALLSLFALAFHAMITLKNKYIAILTPFIVLYLINYLKGKTIDIQTIVLLIMPVLLVLWEGIITKRIVTFNEEKNEWIKIWKDFKNSNG